MRTTTQTRVKVIAASGPDEFEEKLNAVLEELGEQGASHELTFNLNVGFCAYITYTVTKRTPTTAREIMEEKGQRLTCRECPHYQIPMQGNVKYTYCGICDGRVKGTTDACDWFYRAVLQGEEEPRR